MNNTLEKNLLNREKMIDAVREEIIGPSSNLKDGTCINSQTTKEDIKKLGHKPKYSHFFHEFADKREEIVVGTAPSRKYAAGLLYPQSEKQNDFEEDEVEMVLMINEKDIENKKKIKEDFEEENIDVRKENKQSSMGFTFAVPYHAKKLNIELDSGYYTTYQNSNNLFSDALQKTNTDYIIPWWVRKTVKSEMKIDLNRKEKLKAHRMTISDLNNDEVKHYNVRLYSNIREVSLKDDTKLKIVTITLSNETQQGDTDEEKILFQSNMIAKLENNISFEKYPNASDMNANIPSEDRKFEMLYLNEKNYAFGHDCSTNWEEIDGEVASITTTFLPEYEIKIMTPDIYLNEELIEIHHAGIAGASNYEELYKILEPLLTGYKDWEKSLLKTEIPSYYREEKSKNMRDINFAIRRIENGIELLKDENIRKIFQLTNLAMLLQMHNGKEVRNLIFNNETRKIEVDSYEDKFKDLDFTNGIDVLFESIKNTMNWSSKNSVYNSTKWRGFQIAFLLQSIDSIVNPESKERDIVDLIWFPTGGGKTEAYLGVSALSILYRRFLNPEDNGVDTIMRYTLRLLTADQFQRSSRLICSLDYIRSHFLQIFGMKEISIGLWVGTSTTPNYHKKAEELLTNSERYGDNKFIIESCPWCGTEMKTVKINRGAHRYVGYSYNEKRLTSHCPDIACHFHNHLPVYFIDEELYSNPPTFLIGTIDKFVQLTWNPNARSLFGLDNEGNRIKSSPNLIIQDELHLISGPLGSLSGMYEPLIYDLCTDKRFDKEIKPKIVAATATIKDSEKQIEDVFGIEKSKIFPPSGLDINDNYFSTILKDKKSGKPAPGRKYIGVFTSTQGKLQTQVQTYTSLITKTSELADEEKDPFFTLLGFYNTINDIGKARTLIEQDIKNNILTHYQNKGVTGGRVVRNVEELTSRKTSSEVSRFISELKTPYTKVQNKAIDICLASNIIEVGIDIDRLSLMAINGQPKSTSQYIQVSGRIGRKNTEQPGLVVTIYNPQNSADKSHFEHFVEYHQKLYAQVETSSVTPFSQFSIKRGLPAVIIAFIRQNFSKNTIGQYPFREFFEDEDNLNKIMNFYIEIRKKANIVDDSELEFMDSEFERIIINLEDNNYQSWEHDERKFGFMAKITEDKDDIPANVQPVIFSMRNVDSQSRLEVKDLNKKRGSVGRFNFDV